MKAIPIEERFKELESEIDSEFVESITDRTRIREIISNILISAKNEIIVFLPDNFIDSMPVLSDLAGLLRGASVRGINTRILVRPYKQKERQDISVYLETFMEKIGVKCHISSNEVEVKYTNVSLPSDEAVVMKDNEEIITLETGTDSFNPYDESSLLATYSNSLSAIWTHNSIFEKYWAESKQHF
jgi:sugar-specific transcriptional regulator TrmB